MVVLERTRHKNLRSYDLSLEHAFKCERVDRLIAGDKSTEVSSKIVDVLTPSDVPKKIASDDFRLRLAQSIIGARPGVKDRPVIRQLV